MKKNFGLLFTLIFVQIFPVIQAPRAAAFFYHGKPPEEAYKYFDWIVVDPHDVVTKDFYVKNTEVFAYLNVGEADLQDVNFDRKWIIGRNENWNSYIVDVRKKEYREYLFRKIEKEIVPKKFSGVFLDTLDSYKIVLPEKEWQEFEKSIANFILELNKRFPTLKILVNRAFEIFDLIKEVVSGFVFEGLYKTWSIDSFGHITYINTPKSERDRYIQKLLKIKESGIPVIVIDYTDISKKSSVKNLIDKISSHGFIPYISTRNLEVLGYGPLNMK